MKHPDHTKEITRIKKIKGQLEGIQKMIERGEYCIDILNQTKAVSSAVHSLEAALLEKHIQHCVAGAFSPTHDSNDRDKKMEELLLLFRKRM